MTGSLNPPEVCMIFDGETGNALDAFPYTAEELERRARFLRGAPVVTIAPNPWSLPVVTSAGGAS